MELAGADLIRGGIPRNDGFRPGATGGRAHLDDLSERRGGMGIRLDVT
jgi:hypothetical protein